MFDLVRLYCVHVKLWPSDSQEKGNLDGLRPPPGYNCYVLYILSRFSCLSRAASSSCIHSTNLCEKAVFHEMRLFKYSKVPMRSTTQLSSLSEAHFCVSVGADTFSSHMQHVHNTRLIFPHQQINFITCFGEILSVCTFTSRSLVDLCNINRLRVLKGASWCPGTCRTARPVCSQAN